MRAQPCHVIESAMIKTQHVIACRNNDEPWLFDAHGGNRHLGLIQSCSHYFRPIGGWGLCTAGGGGDEILAAKGGCPFDARGNHCRENRARRRDESEHRFVWPRIVAETRRSLAFPTRCTIEDALCFESGGRNGHGHENGECDAPQGKLAG